MSGTDNVIFVRIGCSVSGTDIRMLLLSQKYTRRLSCYWLCSTPMVCAATAGYKRVLCWYCPILRTATIWYCRGLYRYFMLLQSGTNMGCAGTRHRRGSVGGRRGV
eukprot:489058-Rhodomonas_salina.3